MPSVFALIGQSYDFYVRQPALNAVLLWMIILPSVGLTILINFIREFGKIMPPILTYVLVPVGILLLVLIMTWGAGAIIIVGKRLISNPAGRSRTSFESVAKQAKKFVAPLFFTDILRDCITLLWGLLLIIPGVIYAIRTVFYHVIIVVDGKGYRDALRASQEIVKGHTGTVLLYMLGLSLLTFLPAALVGISAQALIEAFDPQFAIAGEIFYAGLTGIASLIFLLSTILLYGELKSAPRPTQL